MPGKVIYTGPSPIDAQPIFVAAIWGSRNAKTGGMLQTYVLRADIDPRDASKLGEDVSVCGDCRHRGVPTLDPERRVAEKRSCYVQLGQGPLIVWNAYTQGKYPLADTAHARAELGAGRTVRLGTYGDPAAVPHDVWRHLLTQAAGHTGYTHNGASPELCMVSVDTPAEAQAAWASKYRTFRVIRDVSELQPSREVLCPASKEAGFRTTCHKCQLCTGTSTQAKSVAIVAHGAGSVHL